MQETDSIHGHVETTAPRRRRGSLIRRFVYVYYVLLALLLLALLPPLISVNRYQRRIAESIGQSLGRPVHLDKVTLNLLPLPSFTIENLVVSEDLAFGSEPIIRANSVRASLRVWPLFRRKIEFSSISFAEPSVNLVHLANGKWNIESILLQASRIQTAPTEQKASGSAPRFPYIEATGARLNLKLGQEKMPISLNDAEFALWLPRPGQWRIRIEAHPARTDTNVSDTGVFRLEGTLGHAATLLDVPINLDAEWLTAPLGEASRVLLGRDIGLRGDLTLSAHAEGTIGTSTLQTRLRLNGFRRADFVPERPLAVDLQCHTTATASFHSFAEIQCAWPLDSSNPRALLLSGSIPNTWNLTSASAKLTATNLPAATIVDWARIVSKRIPADLAAEGTVTASLESSAGFVHGWSDVASNWDGSLKTSAITIQSSSSGLAPLPLGNLTFEAATAPVPSSTHGDRRPGQNGAGLVLPATPLALGGKDPAMLETRLDENGYTLHLTGMVVLTRLLALGKAVPQFGDGLQQVLPTDRAAGPVRLDLTANRRWNGVQTWQDTVTRPVPVRPHRARRRR